VGAPVRVSDQRPRKLPEGDLYESEAAGLVRRMRGAFPMIAADRGDRLELTESEVLWGRDRLSGLVEAKRCIIVSLGTKWPVNDWEEANWMALMRLLNQRASELSVVFLGAKDEHEKSERCRNVFAGASLNLCGATSPRQSSAIMRQGSVFIGHDSGPMHLAAASGLACVAIFSGRCRMGQWFPRGSGHKVLYRLTDCTECGLAVCTTEGKKCILPIAPEEVCAAVSEILSREHRGDKR
jgi:heptosyltransferase-3